MFPAGIPGATNRLVEGCQHVSEKGDRIIVYRDLEDGYRWRLRSPEGETLMTSPTGHREKSDCDAEVRAFVDEHPGTEVVDATSRGPRPG